MKTSTLQQIAAVFSAIQASASARPLAADEAIALAVRQVLAAAKKGNKVILIGNGGSAGICGHIAVDLLKNAGVPALTFNDASLLTCISNDLGYEQVFAKPVQMLAKKGDMLIAVSSSGKSKNILNAARAASLKGCRIITLSGFSPANPLRKMGELNFYVPSFSYGAVEIAHLAVCHAVVDGVISRKHHG
ncbi:MAG TPA: SIS domain-containing protein [Patescibacteria group bacterium]|nr:SIS domain-containing protein [Patescibacteria group bacterium]